MKFNCPNCQQIMDNSRRRGVVTFFCEGCGFSHRGKAGYTAEEVYILLNGNKRRAKNSSGFSVKSRRSSFKLSKSKKLETDPKVKYNDKETRKRIESRHQNLLQPFVQDNSFNVVYYEYFNENLPSSIYPVEDLIEFQGLRKVLYQKGITNLYDFQQESFELIKTGYDLVISAPTGMGKTEAFILPIIESLAHEILNDSNYTRPSTLLIYPTKALAQDQTLKIREYAHALGLTVKKFDGDTSQSDRDSLYRYPPDILITNPDMIHYHLLRNMTFRSLIKRVKFIVIDEIHLCVGSFGSNILWLIRRMRRLNPNFQAIGVSATISNAKEFVSSLFDREVKVVRVGTARKAPLHQLIVYPKEASNLSTMARVAEFLVKKQKKVIVFGNSHLTTEVLNIILKRNGVLSEVHRAGLSINHRNRVENLFRTGKIQVIVSSPTLELGIDIGDLDAVVTMLTGLTNYIQRIGRAGRIGQESIAVLVLRGDDPISAYYARNPSEYLTTIDPVFVEPSNDHVGMMQMLATIIEKPLIEDELPKYFEWVEKLIAKDLLVYINGTVHIKDKYKVLDILSKFNLRGSGDVVKISHNKRIIGFRGLPMALRELHPGAIYLHGGRTYEITNLNPITKIATVNETENKGIRTQALRTTIPKVISVHEETEVHGIAISYISIEITELVTGYYSYNIFTDKVKDKQTLDQQLQYTYRTKGFSINFPPLADQTNGNILGVFHAIEHVLIESGNSLTGSGANEIGGVSVGDTGLVFVYDGAKGGSGLSKLLYTNLKEALDRTLKILKDCPCERTDGCPRCTYSYQCGNNNSPLNRVEAVKVLEALGSSTTNIDLEIGTDELFI